MCVVSVAVGSFLSAGYGMSVTWLTVSVCFLFVFSVCWIMDTVCR